MKKIFKAVLIINYSLLIINSVNAQFTKQDTLRGSNGPGRDWWDVMNYTLRITPDYNKKEISGICSISFDVIKPGKKKLMQIDLQEPMEILAVKAIDSPDSLKFKREKNIYWIDFGNKDFRTDNKGANAIMIQFRWQTNGSEATSMGWRLDLYKRCKGQTMDECCLPGPGSKCLVSM